MTYTVRLVISNPKAERMTLVVEPWAREYPLLPGAELQLVFVGPSEPELEVEQAEDCVTVYAWEGSTFRIFSDGAEI